MQLSKVQLYEFCDTGRNQTTFTQFLTNNCNITWKILSCDCKVLLRSASCLFFINCIFVKSVDLCCTVFSPTSILDFNYFLYYCCALLVFFFFFLTLGKILWEFAAFLSRWHRETHRRVSEPCIRKPVFLSRYFFDTIFLNKLFLSLQTVFLYGFSELLLADLQMTKAAFLLRKLFLSDAARLTKLWPDDKQLSIRRSRWTFIIVRQMGVQCISDVATKWNEIWLTASWIFVTIPV